MIYIMNSYQHRKRLKVDTCGAGGVEKLIPNLNNKEKYVLHSENLKLYEKLGLKISGIYKGIKFYEEDFMKKYIDLNTKLRTDAKN